jgi:hypothetical protein
VCHDVHGRCHEIWSGFTPPSPGNPGGEVMCACAVAGHPVEAAVVIVPVAEIQLPEIVEEVA